MRLHRLLAIVLAASPGCASAPRIRAWCPSPPDAAASEHASPIIRTPAQIAAWCVEPVHDAGAPAIDWTTTSLVAVTMTTSGIPTVDRVTVRGTQATIHVVDEPYCGGAVREVSTSLVFVEIPAATRTIAQTWHERGHCPHRRHSLP